MLKIIGTQIGQYDSSYTDKNTGEVIQKKRIQIMTVQDTKGGKKSVLHDITIPAEKASKYQGMNGKEVTVDVSYFGQNVTFFGI